MPRAYEESGEIRSRNRRSKASVLLPAGVREKKNGGNQASAVGVDAPLFLVFGDLLGRGVIDLLEWHHLELILDLQHGVVERDVVLQKVGNGRLLEDGLPGTFWLACAAIDAFVGIDIELVGEFFLVVADVFVDAVDGAYADTSGVNAVTA